MKAQDDVYDALCQLPANELHQLIEPLTPFLRHYDSPEVMYWITPPKTRGIRRFRSTLDAIHAEFKELICKRTRKYARLRKQISAHGAEGKMLIIGTISGVIGSNLGLAAGAATPYVALCILVMAKVAKEVFCEKSLSQLKID
jgi:hypothetical protein